jgi:ribosomal protein L22
MTDETEKPEDVEKAPEAAEAPEAAADAPEAAAEAPEAAVAEAAAPDAEDAAAPETEEAAAPDAEQDPEPAAAEPVAEAEDDDGDWPEDDGEEINPPEAEEDTDADADAGAEAPAAEKKPRRGVRGRRGAKEETEAPAEPAPRRRRPAREPGAAPPVVRAQARYVRSSARKARLVCDNIRGKSVEEARAILAHTPRAVAKDWSKLLESAVANAEHNHELVGEDLYVKAVMADEGPTIKRFRPRAMGRATKIRKRTAHLTILLTPKD